jgi:hypothetical protein
MSTPSAVDAAVDGLATFLATITGLTVSTEWPAANEKLVFPSVTVTAGKAKRTPIMPETFSVSAPDTNNQVIETVVIGHYDLPIQLDLWCRTKAERRQFLNAILDKFNAQSLDSSGLEKPCGLSLQLTNYYGIYARYEIDTHEFRDEEIAAQRQERRATIQLLVNTREISTRTLYAIKSTTLYSEVDHNQDALTDDTANTEQKKIF